MIYVEELVLVLHKVFPIGNRLSCILCLYLSPLPAALALLTFWNRVIDVKNTGKIKFRAATFFTNHGISARIKCASIIRVTFGMDRRSILAVNHVPVGIVLQGRFGNLVKKCNRIRIHVNRSIVKNPS